jgi:hypothetical protein
MMDSLLQKETAVINVGIAEFCLALEEQKVPVVHVNWVPPTAEDEEIEALLDSLR